MHRIVIVNILQCREYGRGALPAIMQIRFAHTHLKFMVMDSRLPWNHSSVMDCARLCCMSRKLETCHLMTYQMMVLT